MRITLLLLFVLTFQLQAEQIYSQDAKISLDMKNATIEKVLQTIEEKSDYYFLYNSRLIDVDRKVSVRVRNAPISAVLEKLFNSENVNYEVKGSQIILSPKEMYSQITAVVNALQQQKKTITGTVVDAAGEPIIGANIVEVGTTNGTVTDVDGNFSLSVDNNATIHISYIGYLEQEINTVGRTSFDVTLQEDMKTLEEVVVVGYGTMKKSDLTGSVSSVKTSDIQQTPMVSIDQGLVGRASGVQVTQTSGMPGAVASIRVRGSSSLQGGNEPLYVIDGFPVYSGDGFGQTGGNARISGLSSINPSDIESIEILKDAAATAIYGARAANGVVLITTKSGKKGQNLISVEANYGIQQVTKKIDIMNAQEYAALVNEAYTNDGLTPYYNEQRLAEIALMGKGTDWQDLVFRNAITQNYLLSFSGGDEKTTYSISGNYLNQEGVIISSDFERYSLRLNLDRSIKKNFKVGTHINANHTITNAVATDAGGENGVVTGALKMNPVLPVYENEETKEYTQVNVPGTLVPNPYATAKEQLFNNSQSRFLGDMFVEWEFIPNLTFRTSIGADVVYFKANRYTPSTIYQANGLATGTIDVNKSINWLNENTLTWLKTVNDHSFSALGGFTLQQNNSEGVSASSSGFVNDVLTYNALGSGSVYNSPGSSATQWNLMSYLGRINYSYKDRYLFSANARIDGSSRFGENNKYGFFPSVSAGWRISEESFMESLKTIVSNLKLRTSYGFTGNTEIGLYESLPTLGSVSWIIGNKLVTGFYQNKMPNPDLKWERSGQFDLGVDIGLINNRIRITSDVYRKKTTDLLYNVAIPTASGFSSMLKNIGSVENKGLELSIESDNFVDEFTWNTNFNISFNRNKVLELGGEPYKEMPEGDGHLKTGSFRRLIVGEPIGIFYGYKFDGIFQSEEEVQKISSQPSPLGVGYRRYKDLNGDGIVDSSNDRMILGDSNPDFFGGFTNVFSYKGVELNVFFQYSYGNKIFNYNAMELETPTGGQNAYRELLDRWTPTNPSQIYPKATTNRAVLVSDRWLEDGSYLKLKTVSLSYSFPKLQSSLFQNMRLYLTAQNLITWTNYRGYDPEVSYRGASTLQAGEDFGGYPQARTFMMGIQFNIK